MTPKPHSELRNRVLGQARDVLHGEANGDWRGDWSHEWAQTILDLEEQYEDLKRAYDGVLLESDERGARMNSLSEQLETLRELNDRVIRERDEGHAENERLNEQKETADRVLAVADQLAEWVRVTVSVEGVFSGDIGAQAQAQGLANVLTRYVAARDSYPVGEPQ